MIQENFIKMYEQSFKSHWDLPALTDYSSGITLYYKDVAMQIAQIHVVFKEYDIKMGDKIALVGKDSSRWSIIYMSSITYGCVIVPILHEFSPADILNVINHSDSKLLFIDENVWDAIDEGEMTNIEGAFSLNSFQNIYQKGDDNNKNFAEIICREMNEKNPNGFTAESIKYADYENENVLEISYTSGTTGFSKGVMLTGSNLAGNVLYTRSLGLLHRGERELCFLPLAHAYSCTFNMLLPLAIGAHVYILEKAPSPMILRQAFAEVKPHIILMVPLILERIYQKIILPKLETSKMKKALTIPILNTIIYAKVRKELSEALGGRCRAVIVGGASMNQRVANFLHKIKFPFTIGYGMTECGPLISYDNPADYKLESCGQILKDIMEVRIASDNQFDIVGEIQVRGVNVMKGYYKNEKATAAVFTDDGWLCTGDLGTIDADNRIYICGRCKTMILGASGQNIYPEEIEYKLNKLPYVKESVVVQRGRKLIALVYPDYVMADNQGIDHSDLVGIMQENLKLANASLASYEHLAEIQLHATEFEKTPKKSIKRYLYNNVQINPIG